MTDAEVRYKLGLLLDLSEQLNNKEEMDKEFRYLIGQLQGVVSELSYTAEQCQNRSKAINKNDYINVS